MKAIFYKKVLLGVYQGKNVWCEDNLRKLVFIITVVWPKSCLKTSEFSASNCAHMAGISRDTVEESLLMKNMS